MGLTVIIISAAGGLVKGRRQVCCSSPRLDAGQIRGRETAAGSPGPFLAKPGKPLQTGDFPNGRVGNRGKLIDLGPPEVYGGADLQDFDKRGAEYMESKKHFGEYICRRRKELGLTQREFADKLYVTESAVSKWERGLSYPDVTLLRDICAVLDVSEHELLTASVDTERRTAERLAEKYLRLTKTYRVAQYILYGATLLGLAIGNLASEGTLSWFWIAVAAVLLAASLTLVPALVGLKQELVPYRISISLGSALASLELLLLLCCLYSGGDWFPMAAMSVLFGLSFFILPVLLRQLPLPEALEGRRLSVYLVTETVLLELELLTGCLYTGGDWFAMAAVSVLFGLSFFILPVLLRQLPLPEALEGRRLSVYLVTETVLLELELLTGCLYTSGDWFAMAAVSVLFGLSLFILPVLLWQLPLGRFVSRNKLLVWMTMETVLLFALLATGQWYGGGSWLWSVGVPTALVGLALPWGLMVWGRYLPGGPWLRGAACCAWGGIWLWLSPWAVDQIMLANGWNDSQPYEIFWPFTLWGGTPGPVQVMGGIIIALWIAAVALAVVGLRQRIGRR